MNELDGFKIRVQRGHWGAGYDVILMKHPKDSKDVIVIDNITVKSVGYDRIIDPLFSLKKQEAQTLMNDLWDAGLRPSEGSGSAGALLATQKHLDDMRKITFNQLKIG